MTAIGTPFALMAAGRFIFGFGEETLLICVLAGVAQWFTAERAALSMSLLFSIARVGSYAADISPRWAAPLYAAGWQPPLILAAGITGASLLAAIAFWLIDRYRAGGGRRAPRSSSCGHPQVQPLILVHPRPQRAVRLGVLPLPLDFRDPVLPGCQAPEPGRRPGR